MKRIFASVLCLLTVFFCFAPAASAIGAERTQTETLENGDRLVSGVGGPLLREKPENEAALPFEKLLRFFKRLLYLFTGMKTAEKSKYLRYYDANGVLLWEAVLTAEFVYSSKQVRCESVDLSFVSMDRNWLLASRNTEKAGDTARGTVSVRQTKLGVPLQTVTRTLTLTCDRYGAVS